MKNILIVIVLLLGINLSADLFEDGVSEHEKGNLKKASALYKKACDSGSADGCFNLGLIYSDPDEKVDLKKAKEFLKKACDGGNLDGCYVLGDLYYDAEDFNDEEKKLYEYKRDGYKATVIFKKLCDVSEYYCEYYNSMSELGYEIGMPMDLAYALDEYTDDNYKKASVLYEKACDDGLAKGCYHLGKLYYDGEGVEEDTKKASVLYKKACDGGNSDGCSSFKVSEIARGINEDTTDYTELYKERCNSGNAKDCLFLGLKYFDEDKSKSKEWYKKACEAGHPAGCSMIK